MERGVHTLKIIIYGLERALWKLLGESCLAACTLIGEGIYDELNEVARVDISSAGVSEEEALKEIGRVLVDEMGVSKRFEISRSGDTISIEVEDCILMDVEDELIRDGIKPFVCPYMNLTAYIMRKRLKMKTKITGIEVDPENRQCHLKFEMLK